MTANPKIPLSKASSRSQKIRDRLMSSGFLLSALLLHIVVFLMVATWIIFPTPAEPQDTRFSNLKIKPIPPPSEPPAISGGEAASKVEPNPVIIPPSAPVALPHTEAPASFTLNASTAPMPQLPDSYQYPDTSGYTQDDPGMTGPGAGPGNPFGTKTSSQQSLSGTFYDLKQTPERKPTKMDAKTEQDVLRTFFANGWDESTFKQSYLSSKKPLFSNELMVPFQFSAVGPAAFGLQSVCKPGYWAVIYHVKINPTRPGDFYLAGFGDDFLVARVNGVNVLDSGYYPPVTTSRRTKTYPHGPWLNDAQNGKSKTYGNAVVGDQFHLNAGDELSLDVFIGDADPHDGRGRCGYFLFLLEDRDYPQDAQGNYIFPLLQIHPDADVKRTGEYPPFTCQPEDALTGS